MKTRNRNWSYIIIGSLIILASFSLFIWKAYFIGWVIELTAVIMGVYGLIQLYQGFSHLFSKQVLKTTYVHFAAGMGLLVFGVWLWRNTILSVGVLGHMIGIYQLIMGFINVINYFLLRQNDVSDHFWRILYAIIHILMGLSTMFDSLTDPQVINRLALYILFIGFTYINDGRGVFISSEQSGKMKRNFRFPLPIIFHALLPQKMIRQVTRFIEEELDIDEEYIEKHQRRLTDKKGITSDNILQVQISMSPDNLDILGHTNIIYKDKVYTYGNHDVDSRRMMFLIGDGVLAVCDKESYLDYTLKQGTTIVEYDILLTDNQKEALEDKLAGLKTNTRPWTPQTKTQINSNGGNLIRETNTQLYKFKEGRYKTYFALGTNCVLLTDDIIGVSGLDLFAMVGVLTPGTYYDYFEKEYKKEYSIIINRKIYNQHLFNYLEIDTA